MLTELKLCKMDVDRVETVQNWNGPRIMAFNRAINDTFDIGCKQDYTAVSGLGWQQVYACMSCVVRKPAFCICKNKDADQLRGNCEAYQHLYFRYRDSTIPLFSRLKRSCVVVLQPGLCRTWSETPKTGYFTTRLV